MNHHSDAGFGDAGFGRFLDSPGSSPGVARNDIRKTKKWINQRSQ